MIAKALIRKYENELERETAKLNNCSKFDKLLITQKILLLNIFINDLKMVKE